LVVVQDLLTLVVKEEMVVLAAAVEALQEDLELILQHQHQH
jgi:hypothetical protein